MPQVCKHLFEDIQFFNDRIIPCVAISDIDVTRIYFIELDIEDNEGSSVDFALYKDTINKHIQQYKEGKMPVFCENCNQYEPVELEENKEFEGFKNIFIKHKSVCNCKCIYCTLADGGKMYGFKKMNSQQSYDIRPFLKQMDELNLIQNGAEIFIDGGECTEYPEELEAIIDFGIKNNCKFLIETNGIIYNKKIDYLLNENAIELRIPLDAGTKETFEKIKRVDKWEQVIENIENYSLASGDNEDSQIYLKYIICPGINDNIEELKAFFEFLSSLRIEHLILSIDKYWIEKNQYKEIPLKLKQLINYYLKDSTYNNITKDIDYGVLPKDFVDKARHLSIIDKIKLKQLK